MANQTNFTTNIIDYKQRFKELLNNWGKFAPGTVDELMKFCDDQFNQLKQASKLKDNEENAYYQRMCSAIITTNFDVSIFILILSALVLLPRARPPHDQRLALSTSLSSSVKHRSSVPVGVHHPSSSSIIVSTSHSHSRVQVQVIGNVETVEKNMLPKASC